MEESLFTSRLYRPHHYTLFEPRPNIYSQQGLVHNRWGFREHRPLPPDPLAIRLVFIGGSIVYGVRTHDNCELYTRHLEERLNETYREQLGERHFEVINAGMANATTNEILLRLIFAVSEIRPALVAIQAGICDTWPRTVSDDYFGDYRQARKRYGHGRWLQPELSLADSLARALIWRSALLDLWLGNQVPAEPLLEMCDVERTGHPDRLVRNPPIYFERNLRFMLTLCREMGAFSLLIGDPVPVSQRHCSYQIAVPEHSAVMERLSGERGVPFLDLGRVLPLTDDIRTGDKYLNAEGQRRLAAAIFDHLQQSGQINALLTGVSAPDVPTS
jgi:lysophospholipase L1-like esterase